MCSPLNRPPSAGADGRYLVTFGGAQRPPSSLDIGLHLLGAGGAGDDRRDLWIRQLPGECQVENGVASFAGPLFEALDPLEHLVGEEGGEVGAVAGARQASSLGKLL